MQIFIMPILLVSFALSASASSNVPIKGIIEGEDGKAVDHAYVLLHDNWSTNEDYVAQNWQMWTVDGSFSFTAGGGCYDIFVSSIKFLPFSQRFCTESNDGTTLKIKLKADKHLRAPLE